MKDVPDESCVFLRSYMNTAFYLLSSDLLLITIRRKTTDFVLRIFCPFLLK